VNIEDGHTHWESGDFGLVGGACDPVNQRHIVEVPPMSKPIMRLKPLRRARAAAPTTPPAGPERTVRTG